MVKILLSGGGTLGSVSPLIAIQRSVPEADYLFIGTRRGVEREFVQRHGIRYKHIWVVKFRRYLSLRNVIDALKFPFVFLQALILVAQYRPDIILTSGSFVSVPVAYAGRLFGCTIFIHQQDLEIGLANRLIMRIADVITTSFESQSHSFPGKKVHWTGNPTRLPESRDAVMEDLILILGGSTGAQGLNELVARTIAPFSKDYEIVHVLGRRNYYQRLSLGPKYRAVQFLEDEYATVLQQAKVVVSRSGMSTMTELAQYGKAAILIPMPDSHQESNAAFFREYGAARVVKQDDDLVFTTTLRSLLDSPEERTELISGIRKLMPSDANPRYAQLLRSYFPKSQGEKLAYFIGIGGIGISAMVEHCIAHGYKVMGSDLRPNAVTKRLEDRGVRIFYDHRKENMPDVIDLVIYSTAVPENNEEIVEARRRHAACYSYKEYLGMISANFKTIAISGTHGKTTTTALTGLILREGGLDPTIIVGSFVPQLDLSNYHAGSGNHLVVEADEYRSDMLLLHPTIAAITNIDLDHLDFYKDIDDITRNFQRFVDLVPAHGIVITNADDVRLQTPRIPRRITVGFSDSADYRATQYRVAHGKQHFSVVYRGEALGECSLSIPGRFNVSNALVGIAIGCELGLGFDLVARSSAAFKGTWRRCEYLGTRNGALVYTDYAHHPTAVQATIRALKELHPEKKVILVFQPHSYDRTEKLFDQFSRAFAGVEHLLLLDIYDVAGRDHAKHVDSEMLSRAIKNVPVTYCATTQTLLSQLDSMLSSDVDLCIMGAGDIDTFARTIV